MIASATIDAALVDARQMLSEIEYQIRLTRSHGVARGEGDALAGHFQARLEALEEARADTLEAIADLTSALDA